MERAVVLSESGGMKEMDVQTTGTSPMFLNHFSAFGVPNIKIWVLPAPQTRENRNASTLFSVFDNGNLVRGKWAVARVDGRPITVAIVNQCITKAQNGGKLFQYYGEWKYSKNEKFREYLLKILGPEPHLGPAKLIREDLMNDNK